MFCKHILALFLWCHCYQIVLNPLYQSLAIGLSFNSHYGSNVINYGNLYVAGNFITVAANKISLTPGQEIALRCNIPEYPNAQFSWFKIKKNPISSEFIDSLEDRKELGAGDDRYSINNNVMVIKSSTLADVGDYFCQVKEPLDGIELEKMISVRPRPIILDFQLESSTLKSAIVEEGKSLKLQCNVIDEYFPPDNISVTWHMSKFDENDMNDVTSGEDGIRIEIHNKTSQDLVIDRVTKDHRRLYKCQVSNGVTDNSKAILIRVKDKYAVIWPAVGIVIEIVILIGVICVVENRKVEPDKDAYDRKAIHM